MGLIGRIFGGTVGQVGQAVTNVADGFRPNATKAMILGHESYRAALDQHGKEFQYGRIGWFDALMNGLNRLPRPFLAIGTLGLFVFAMVDPESFAPRMVGLNAVPEPLWWLLGAIVSFYFGARELHYARRPGRLSPRQVDAPAPKPREIPSPNAALEAWRARRGG
ncbi:MAG: holin family protein [Litoreibacter sp.]|nr:holin family protein [Litoreibacter sp.]